MQASPNHRPELEPCTDGWGPEDQPSSLHVSWGPAPQKHPRVLTQEDRRPGALGLGASEHRRGKNLASGQPELGLSSR